MNSANPASYREVLATCRSDLGPAPRSYGLWDRLTYLRINRPAWAAKDPLGNYFDNRDSLLRDGVVVWGHLVQANQQLFSPGPNDCPGEVVLCPDPKIVVDPAALQEVSRRIGRLKGTTPADAALAKIAHHLTNERTRVFGLPVPKSVSPTFPAVLCTIFFQRKHLPTGKLTGSLFPMLVMPQPPRYAMVVPGRYWPAALADFWSR
jgi:hypothetical protein